MRKRSHLQRIMDATTGSNDDESFLCDTIIYDKEKPRSRCKDGNARKGAVVADSKGIEYFDLVQKGKPRNRRTGSTSSVRRGSFIIDSDGEVGFQSEPKTLETCLQQLYDSKRSVREEALSAIVEALTNEIEQEFVEKNFSTILYHSLCCIRKGSTKDLQFAPQAIGLLGMILEDKDYAHEVYEDSISVLSQALRCGSKALKILDCLAIVTFFGAGNSEETERAMQIIWKFLNPDSNSDANSKKASGSTNVVLTRKHSAPVLAAAISAWSFLLTTMEGWRLNHKYWQGAISYLSNLMEESEETVYKAATEALALIFETNCLEKFLSKAEDSTSAQKVSLKQELKDNITEKLRRHAMKASEAGVEQEAKSPWKADLDVLKFFEDGECLQIYISIGQDWLMLPTLSQVIQLNFMKRFLGEDGFVKHMKENEQLHSIFEFAPGGEHLPSNVLYTPNREEVTLRFFQPGVVKNKDCSLLLFISNEEKMLAKRMTLSPSSFLNKARTRLRNKQRMLSQGNDFDHIMVDD